MKTTKIALTGATGDMGQETLKQLLASTVVESIKILVLPEERKKGKALKRKYGNKLTVIFGDLFCKTDCQKLVADVDYVVNLAAVIPPLSDQKPELSERANDFGVKNLVEAIEELGENQPKLIHTSTVALFGNRNSKHMWAKIGDPLLPSVYDIYALSKLRGEFRVLESKLKTWVVLRQTAMLHKRMMTDNISDGLMFHTCFNAPLEWVTARDSGRLVVNIIEKDLTQSEQLKKVFWKKCFNIGGGANGRCTGYDTFLYGFRLIGGTTEKFFKPNWNATRNFHGVWYLDSHILNDIFDFVRDGFADYWKEIGKKHWYYAFAKILPSKIISAFVLKPLLKNKNSPTYWFKNGEEGKIIASFGSLEAYKNLPKDWKEFPLLKKGFDEWGEQIDYNSLLDPNKAQKLQYGFDDSKPDCDIDLFDVKSAAEFRGGKLISTAMQTGDMYTALEFECSDGHRFFATPYTVLRAGHWCIDCFKDNSWNFDKLAKKNKFFAQIWYDSHEKGEDLLYWSDESYNAHYKRNN